MINSTIDQFEILKLNIRTIVEDYQGIKATEIPIRLQERRQLTETDVVRAIEELVKSKEIENAN